MADVSYDREPLVGSTEKCQVMTYECVRDDHNGDIIIVCPIKISADTHAKHEEQTKLEDMTAPFYGKEYKWGDTIKDRKKGEYACYEAAKKIFCKTETEENEKDDRKHMPSGFANLKQTFAKSMSRLEFQDAVVKTMVDILCGHKVALELNTIQSVDHDELFLCLKVPEHNDDFVRECADSEHYRAKLKKEAYIEAGVDYPVPKVLGQDCPAWIAYEELESQKFEAFREIDKLRMMQRRIGHFISLSEAQKAGVVVNSFVAHKWTQLEELSKPEMRFSNVRWWFQIPHYKNMEPIKLYFGEEITLFFHWFAYYIHQLMFPAFLGFVIFFRRFLPIDLYQQRYIQESYAVVMALWAAHFCEQYSRLTLQQASLWGTRNYDLVALVRPEYREEKEYLEARWKRIGASVMAVFLFCIVSGIVIIQTFRHLMITHPTRVTITEKVIEFSGDRDLAVKFGKKIGALMITFQIKTLDFIWSKISVFCTNAENHKTYTRWTKSLIYKTVFVKFFNAMYPFIYFAFAKEYVEGCHTDIPEGATKREKIELQLCACIAGLQLYIMTFFVVHMMVVVAMLVKRFVFARYKIRKDLSKPGIDISHFTYLQFQAKCDPFSGVDMINDYMEATVQFGLVVCFSVVLPVLTVLALVSNLLEYRLIAYRQCYVVQRAHPAGADGIGAWLEFFRLLSYMAIGVNAGLAVFAMLPFKEYPMETKLLLFLAIEHALLFLKLGVEASIPDVPKDVDKADDKNDDAVAKIFGGQFKPIEFEYEKFGTKKPIMISSDGEDWNALKTYTHQDLQDQKKIEEEQAAKEKEAKVKEELEKLEREKKQPQSPRKETPQSPRNETPQSPRKETPRSPRQETPRKETPRKA